MDTISVAVLISHPATFDLVCGAPLEDLVKVDIAFASAGNVVLPQPQLQASV